MTRGTRGIVCLCATALLPAASAGAASLPFAATELARIALTCSTDATGDGDVDVTDLLLVLEDWGQTNSNADVNGDGTVGTQDLLDVLDAWGPCEDGGPGGDAHIAYLTPGSGWSGPTAEPGPVGSPGAPGYSAKAIARWDTVPFQAFTDTFEIGVLAFHREDIDRVEFAVDGGPWKAADKMTLNPRTEVWEYQAVLDADDFGGGPVEVRAIAYPKVGQPRLLEPLRLHAAPNGIGSAPVVYVDAANGSDTGGTGTAQNPFRNLWRASRKIHDLDSSATGGDGAVIYCKPGTYEWYRPGGESVADTSHTWLTVQAAPGVDADDVHIVRANGNSNNGLNTKLVRLHEITLSGDGLSLQTSGGADRYIWLDTCRVEDDGKPWTTNWYDGSYVTDTVADGVTQHAFITCNLVRHTTVTNFGGDAFKGALCAVHCSVSKQVGLSNPLHSDIWQNITNGVQDNIILYGLTASNDMDEQGIFTRTWFHSDIAIINCNFDMSGYPSQHQWKTLSDHLVVRYNTFTGTPFLIGLSDPSSSVQGFYGSTNCEFEHNIFQWVKLTDSEDMLGGNPNYQDLLPGTTFDGNHFINEWPAYTGNGGQSVGEPYGTNYTTGPNPPTDCGAYGTAAPPWN